MIESTTKGETSFMLKRSFATAILFILLSSLLLACTNNKEIQSIATQAIAKQSEIKSYSFVGNAKLGLSDGLIKSTNPLTLGFINMLKEATLEWQGVVQNDPTSLEINLKVTPKGANTPIEVPVLIKDNKMYFYIPVFSKTDEYFMLDMATLGKSTNGTNSPLGLQQATSSLSTIMSTFVNNADSKWFSKDKEPVQFPDGTSGQRISVEITSSNEKAATILLQNKLGEMIDSLTTSGIISSETSDKWKQNDPKQYTIIAPSKLQLVIDGEGYIRDQSFDLKFAITDSTGTTNTHAISIHQSISNINQTPAFQMKVPQKVKSLDEIMKFITSIKTTK